MVFAVLVVLLSSSIVALLSENISPKNTKKIYLIFFLILTVVAGFRDGETMPDYEVYQGLYSRVNSFVFLYFIEISFIFIAKLSFLIISGNPIVLFVIYAILGVSLKMYFIKKISNLCFYSLVIYISNYYIIHEMIQIRAGVATAFIFLSIISLYNNERKSFLILMGCAFLFHYSSIIFLLLWFLKSNKYNKILYVSLIPIAYLMHYSGTDPISLIVKALPSDLVSLKGAYLDKERSGRLAINVLGIFILTRVFILFYFTFFVNQIKKYNKYIFILLKFYTLGVFAYIAFAKYPEFAVRISYTLMIGEIIIVPTLIYTIKGYYLPRLIVILYGVLAFLLNVYFTTYFNFSY